MPPNYAAGDAIFSLTPSAVVFNSKLYAFCNSADGGGQPYYCSYDGSSWSDYVEVPGTGMSASPSPVVFNGSVYLFHQGEKQNGQLWCNVMSADGTWNGDTQLILDDGGDDVPMYGNLGPSAVVFNNQIYCFFNQGEAASNGYLGYVVVTGSDTLKGGSLTLPLNYVNSSPAANVDQCPAAIVYNNVLYVFTRLCGRPHKRVYVAT